MEINRVHKGTLRALLSDYESTFECLLTKNNEIAIHTINIQKLLTEIYRSLNHESPTFMGEVFVQRELTYQKHATNPAYQNDIFRHKLSRIPREWNTMPDTTKSAEIVFRFKKGIKAWIGDKCSCNICK